MRCRSPRLLEARRPVAARPGSRGPGPCRRGGPSPPTSARASRPYLRSWLPNVPSWPRRAVERAVLVGRARSDRRPQVVRRPARERRPARPDRDRRWASLLPTVGQPVLRGEADDPAVPGPAEHRRVERLDRVGADARCRRRASRRRSTQPWAHSGYGTSGWAGIAMPPCSWTARDRRAEAAQRPDALLEEQRRAGGRRRVETSSPTITSRAEPEVPGHRPGRDRGVDPLVVGDRDDVEVGLALDVVEDRRRSPSIPSEARVWMWRSARPSRSVMAAPRRSGAGLVRRRLARSGQIGKNAPTTARGRRRSAPRSAAASAASVAAIRSRRVPVGRRPARAIRRPA